MITKIEMLERIAESIRQARRSYTKPLDTAYVRIDDEENRLIISLRDNDVTRVYTLELQEITNEKLFEMQ